ncbi:MAG: phosphate ABC transporter permease PstA [Methylococcales bacterium]
MNRKLLNAIFTTLMWLATVICCAVLCFIITVIVSEGAKAITVDFLFTPAKNFGSEGGIVYQIFGSFLLIVFAGFMSLPVALGVALYKSEYLENPRLQRLSDLVLYGLNAVPSVVFGIFGLIFFVNILHTGLSWLVGAVILAIMILPTIILSCYQVMNSIPNSYREAARALGFDTWQVITKVILPQGVGGAITGLLIGLARAVGETAPIMFVATAFSGVTLPGSLNSPVSTLPTHILALSKQATQEQALVNAWGTSLVLLGIVLLLSSAALASREFFKIRV